MLEVDRQAPAEVVKAVVGLKADAGVATVVSEAEAASFAGKHGAICVRCSARDGANVPQLFEALAEKLVRNGFDPDGTRRRGQGGNVKLGGKGGAAKKQSKGCC